MFPIRKARLLPLFALLFGVGLRAADYLTEIKPLLRERCYSCHGGLKQKKNLRLDTAAAILKGGASGPAIERGQPGASLILKRIASPESDERMPPEHEGERFNEAQIELLRDWIAAGAPTPQDEKGDADPRDHWAFRPCVRPTAPRADSEWARNPIDSFIARGYAEHGLTPQSEAPREVLLRRLYFDLVGVPPTAEELRQAQRDSANGWYEAIVERLLNDPRYGERWARHWMDVWRYSDWYGLGDQLRNSQPHIWHWRDWIIESLNADLPYDEMIRLMLAADELHPNEPDKLRATGYLARNYFLFNRNQWLEETVEHVSKGFLGLTMNCAKCHDHKYDPIRQSEFYQLRAFFEPYHVRLDLAPSEPDLAKDGIPRAFDALLETPTYRFVRGQENQPDKKTEILAKPPDFLAFRQPQVRPVPLPVEAYRPERRAWVLPTYLAAAQRSVRNAEAALPRSRDAFVQALRRELALVEADNLAVSKSQRDEASRAVNETRASLAVSEAALEFARAELASVERRGEAMRKSWTGDPGTNELTTAIKAERAATVAKARLGLAEAEDRLNKSSEDKKESANKDLKTAREAFEKARQANEAPIKPEDRYTQLSGARWTPTRFLNSTADDPAVPFPPQSSGRRTALAEWITDPRNPLTARVAVNHIWTRHFGTPLASPTFDLGRKAPPPANPELIDWLAAELMESGWSMKHLHRLIVTSAAYRVSSSLAGSGDNAAKDPDNVYLWRRNPIRLEAEAVRDSMLALAGALDRTMRGPSIPPDQQEASRRRSLYFFHSNNDRNLFLATFDAAGVKECYRREQSIVPQQALAMTNSKLAFDCAESIAARFASNSSDEQFIRDAMLELLSIDAGPAEVAACRKALDIWRQEKPGNTAPTPRAQLVWSLLNHNDFVTLR